MLQKKFFVYLNISFISAHRTVPAKPRKYTNNKTDHFAKEFFR